MWLISNFILKIMYLWCWNRFLYFRLDVVVFHVSGTSKHTNSALGEPGSGVLYFAVYNTHKAYVHIITGAHYTWQNTVAGSHPILFCLILLVNPPAFQFVLGSHQLRWSLLSLSLSCGA